MPVGSVQDDAYAGVNVRKWWIFGCKLPVR